MSRFTLKRILALLATLALLCAQVTFASAEQETIPDLTIDQLIAMNDGNLIYTMNDEGNITFLQGKFCEEKVTDLDSVVRALGGVLLLLGGDENTAFSRAVGVQDDYGNNYYSLYQWSGDMAVQNAIVKIITDPEGNTIALSSSIVPGKADQPDSVVEPEKAVEIVKEYLKEKEPGKEYFFYDEVDKSIIPTANAETGKSGMTLVYIVYTNNPDSSVATNDLPYIAHYVSSSGIYQYGMPVSNRGSELAKAGSDPLSSFDGMEPAEYTGTVTLYDGSTKEITVPVMKDAEGTYYLGDLQRHIAMADCWEFIYNDGNVVISSSKDNTDWDDKQLLSYEAYILAHDYYAAVGWYSTDGLHTPILLLANYCDENKNPVDNACYMGKLLGWQCFCATSDLNNYCEALDIIGHEYTHGFTTAAMTAIRYENQYGAINESMSDIMGNIMEMLTGRTDDTNWLMGEMAGRAIRSMTNPNLYSQPAYVGDQYYVPEASVPSASNDRGGVHINNSILCVVATKLINAGMTLEEARALWTTFICGLTPSSDYKDVCQMLPFAAKLSGLDRFNDEIVKALSEIGLDNADPFGTIKEGCGLLSMEIPEGIDANNMQFVIVNDLTQTTSLTWPNAKTGTIAIVLGAGSYKMAMGSLDPTQPSYFFDGEKWTNDGTKMSSFTIAEGETFVMPTEIETVELQTEQAPAEEAPATADQAADDAPTEEAPVDEAA